MTKPDACALGCIRSWRAGSRAASKARRLGRRWEALSQDERRRRLTEIEQDMKEAHSLIRSVIAVARHEGEA